jgi:ATP-binding cassette subfamily F protein uup
LQELLADYPGTVLLVSHDRDFLDRVVTSVLAPEGDGRWSEYPGGYSDMLVQRQGEEPQKSIGDRDDGASVGKASAAAAVAITANAAPRKLSFRKKHARACAEHRQLEADIAKFATSR